MFRVTARRLVIAMAVASIGAAWACNNTVAYIEVPPEGGASSGEGGASDGSAGGATTLQPDGAGYLEDLGPQSSASGINPAHTSSSDDPSLGGAATIAWTYDFDGKLAYPLIAHGKLVATYVSAQKHAFVQAFDAKTGAPAWGPVDIGPTDIASSTYDGGRVFVLDRDCALHALDVEIVVEHAIA